MIILDDLQEVVYRSPVVSQIFSKGRHVNVSCLLLLQTYFPTGSGKNLLPQIKNNSTIQIFTRTKSHREIALIADRLEHIKKSKELFIALFRKVVQHKRFGYLAALLDASDEKLRYCNNLLGEDGSPFPTFFI